MAQMISKSTLLKLNKLKPTIYIKCVNIFIDLVYIFN